RGPEPIHRPRQPHGWKEKPIDERHGKLVRQLMDWADYLLALDLFSVTPARTRAFNASSFIFSPSWKSIARLVFPSRLELKRPEGSFRAAPLAKVIFTAFL